MKKYTFNELHKSIFQREKGVSLIVVLLLLVIVSMLGVASMQISMMGERGARNDRDMQLAWQGAEAGLLDAQKGLVTPGNPFNAPDIGCSNATGTRGFCRQDPAEAKPVWLSVDFTDITSNARTAEYGTYTSRDFANAEDAEGKGTRPALAPRYVVEDLDTCNPSGSGVQVTSQYNGSGSGLSSINGFCYRITAMGFGPRADIQAVSQVIFKKLN